MSAGFVGRLARSPRYLLALVLVAAGFGLSILALRTLPLFVVQAGRASSLAITAVLSVLLLRVRLRTAEVIAVIGIGAGLVVVALTAGPQQTAEVGIAVRFALLGGRAADRRVGRGRACGSASPAHAGLVLAVLAGLCFGALAVGARSAARVLAVRPAHRPGRLGEPVPAGLGLLLGAIALQRAGVVTVTAAMVATETLVGAASACCSAATARLPDSRRRGARRLRAGGGRGPGVGPVRRAGQPDARGHEEPAALPIA